MTTNLCIASVTTKAREAYSGKITNIIRSSKGVDLHVSSRTINVASGQEFTVDYPSLYFARNGDVLRLVMEKEDGSPLKVWRGSMNSRPWRTLRARVFSDVRLDAKVTQTSDGLMSKEDKAKLDITPPFVLKDKFYAVHDFHNKPTLSNTATAITEQTNNITFNSQNIRATFPTQSDGNHFGIQGVATSTTSGGYFQITNSNFFFNDLAIRAWFKTPSTFNETASVIVLGTFVSGNTLTDRSGLIIEGSKAFGGMVTASASVEKGAEYTLSPDTWYIGKHEMLPTGKFKATLFSDAGVELFSYTSTSDTPKPSSVGFKVHSKTTTADVFLVGIDMIDFTASLSANRTMV